MSEKSKRKDLRARIKRLVLVLNLDMLVCLLYWGVRWSCDEKGSIFVLGADDSYVGTACIGQDGSPSSEIKLAAKASRQRVHEHACVALTCKKPNLFLLFFIFYFLLSSTVYVLAPFSRVRSLLGSLLLGVVHDPFESSLLACL